MNFCLPFVAPEEMFQFGANAETQRTTQYGIVESQGVTDPWKTIDTGALYSRDSVRVMLP